MPFYIGYFIRCSQPHFSISFTNEDAEDHLNVKCLKINAGIWGNRDSKVLPPGLEAKLVLEEAELKSFLNGRF